MNRGHRRLWATILAAGEGTRLLPLTTRLYGEPVPKQFATLVGDRSLLQETVARIEPLVPPSRMVVVVAVAHEGLARAQLAPWPEIKIVVQPCNRGTGPGVLLPAAHVLAADPDARIAVVPSDHHVPNPRPMLEAMARAACHAEEVPLTLLAVQPERADTDLGWIRPGRALGSGLREVAGFVEKPDRPRAERLHAEGALWNTFLMVGNGRRLWDLAAARMPEQAACIRECVASGAARLACLAQAYQSFGAANFSHDVLEGMAGLGVAAIEGSGWCDWGTPERVFGCLRGTAACRALRERLRASAGLFARWPADSTPVHLSWAPPPLGRAAAPSRSRS